MTRKDKLIDKLKNQASDHNWSMDEIEKLLSVYGIHIRQITGSHHNFSDDADTWRITIPSHNNRVKACYVRQLRRTFIK